MKVALVSSHPALPASEGNRSRIQQLAHAVLQMGHEVTFILLPLDAGDVDDAAHEAFFGPGRYFRVARAATKAPEPGRNYPGKWTLQQIRKTPARVREQLKRTPIGRGALAQCARVHYGFRRLLGLENVYYSHLDAMHDPVRAQQLATIGRGMDVVIVEYVFHSWAFECFPRMALRVLDTHDAFANRHRSYLARGVGDYWFSLRPEDENAGFRRADVILAIQQEEAQRFRQQLAADPGRHDPEIVAVSHLMPQSGAPVDCSTDKAAVFVASNNAANRHALDSFIRHVLPRVVQEVPDFSLKLVGSICMQVPDLPNVVKLGWVADLKEAFAQAPVAINPMLVGTGINIKLLEAMAAGVPTVSTETGVRGLPQGCRSGVLVVPDLDYASFAEAVVRCARDANMRRRLGSAAFADAKAWNAEQISGLGRSLDRPSRDGRDVSMNRAAPRQTMAKSHG